MDYSGIDTLDYRVEEQGNAAVFAVCQITIYITPREDAPRAMDDSFTVAEDSLNTPLSVTSNDFDVEGVGFSSVSIITPPNNGGVATAVGLIVEYSPAPNFNGGETFVYQVVDNNGRTDTATVFMTVTPAYDAFVAVDDFVTTFEDIPATIEVLANDQNIDNLPLLLSPGALMPTSGSISINPDNTITYTPDLHFVGRDTFEYDVNDGMNTDTGLVTIDMIPVTDGPVATDDMYMFAEDAGTQVLPVTSNDLNVDIASLYVSIVSSPNNGGLAVVNGLDIEYTSAANFNGIETFVYRLSDSAGQSDTATVTIDVTSVPEGIIANPDSTATVEDTAVDVYVLANDEDPDNDINDADIAIFMPPANGMVAVNNLMKFITYTPNANYFGTDTFQYEISNVDGDTAVATVTITIQSINDNITAVDDPNNMTDEDMATIIDVTSNDINNDGATLTVTISSPPSNGVAVVISGTPDTVQYTPNMDFNGVDSFEYTISTSLGATDSAVVTITVNPIDDPIQAFADDVTTWEDTPVRIDVLENDYEPDGDTITIAITMPPTNGAALVVTSPLAGANGPDIMYTPDPDFVGTDTFEYSATDSGSGIPSLATVTVTIIAVNDPVVANDDSYTVAEDSVNTPFPVTLNDVDPDNDPGVFISIETQPTSGGTATVSGLDILYSPGTHFNGIDTFTYTFHDSFGSSDTATVTVTVTPAPDSVVAVDDSISTPEDTTVDIYVLDNDINIDGNPLTVTITTNPLSGTASVIPYGPGVAFIRYTPNAGYFGPDSLVYEISDTLSSSSATVSITVRSVDDGIFAVDDLATVDEDSTVPIDVTANDSNPDGGSLTVSISRAPLNGVVTVVGTMVNYQPHSDFNGQDSFEYTIRNAIGHTSSATVRVTVNPINDPILAVDDSASTHEDFPVVIYVLANDINVDRNQLFITGVTTPSSGTVTRNGNGTITYTPNLHFFGVDTFDYTITSVDLDQSTATVTVTVFSQSDPITAVDDFAGMSEDSGTITINVIVNDNNPDNLPLVVTVHTLPNRGGTATVVGQSIEYTPALNFNGEETFYYQIEANGMTDIALVTVTVAPSNDPPVAVADSATTREDVPVVISVLANDINVDNNPLTVAIVSAALNGDLSVNANNTITYTPNLNFNGADSFIYRIRDTTDGEFSDAMVTITITPVSDGLVAHDDYVATRPAASVVIDVLANDENIDNDPITVQIQVPPNEGTAVVNGNNTITFTASANFLGTDYFIYNITSTLDGDVDSAFVYINITAFICPCGTYLNSSSADCEPCPAGTSSIDGELCDACGPGFISGPGQCICTDCGPGMESDSTRTMCVPCPAGTYSEGSGACGLCPTNQISNIGAKECIPCPCGTQKVGLICEPCGDNLFSTEGEACHLCPPGHVATLGQCQCNDCGPGHEAVFDATLGRTICAPCQPGTFSPGTGQCARCPPGYATPFPGAIECYSCGCGLEPSANQDNCIECYPGFFSENSELCDICPPGTYANQTGQCQCTDCGPGYESNSNRTQCITCEPGFFSPGLGNCTRCKTGTISPRGSRDCAPCPCGQEASPDQSECVFCPPGQASTGNGNCDVCQPGFVTTIAGECECYPCDIGFQASSTQDRCEPCPPGTVNSRVGGVCVTCDRGFISDQDGTRCIPCPCGTEYFNTTTCLICPEGTFSAGGKCDVCPPATYANSPGQCSCTHCGPGYHPNANRTTCEPCPAGTYSPAEAECIECPLGTISTEGSETCVSCGCGREPNDSKTDCAPCPPGTFSGDDQRCDRCPLGKISVLEGQCSCADCPPGYQSDPTRTVCQPCPAGTFSIGGSGCVQCELGSYSLEGSGSCSPCDCGKAPNPTRSDCDLCPVGEFSSHGVACSSCPLGTISSSPGFCSCLDCGAGSQAVNSTRCELCAPGTYSPGAGQCLPCPTGTVSLSFGAEACVPCSCGTTPNSNRTLCDACPPGSFSNAGGTCQTCPPGAVAVNDGACECDECGAGMGADATRTVCVLCDPGFYSPGDGECQRCPRGTVAPGPGSDSCDECNCGHQPNSGASNCEMCPPGTFSTPGGLCQDCPRNQVSNSGACHCESCGLGYQANEPQNFCSLCPAGTFSPNDGQCQVCPTGTFSTAGAANCSVCPPGHTPNAGFRATGCSQCPAGTYSSDGVACYSCPQGTVTTVAGQSSCTPCGCGYEAATTVCVPCAAGEFSTPDGNCQACPTGSASTSEASCSCDRCPPGTEASADRTTCNVCNPGTYSEAGEACQRCQPGSAASDFGSSRCEPCPIGHGDTTVASICGQCPAGFSSGVGETCSPCLPGQISVIGGPCQDCPAGYGNIDVRFRDVCGPCPAGSSSEVGGECVRCKEGQIARSGEICRPCDPGHEPNFQQSECVSCPQGTFSRNGEPCIPCLQGTISNGPGAIECTICPAGFTSNSARTRCIPCQAGYSSVPGGVCVECQGGSTSKSGALCEPCAPGNGDTHTLPGTCLPCEYGHSSELGGICVKCPVGQEAFPGGLCTDCPAGFGADVGGLCGPCPEGQSSSPGGACTDCLPGYYSYSGGLCHPCPAGYSSSGGSSECRQCEYGQFSLSGGQCVDRCPAGQAWSYIFQQCAICPKDTFSEAGDTSCTECPDGRYAPEESPSCWSSGRIGGRMRITQSFDSFYLPDWVHCVAVLLDSEARDIVVWNAYRDPTIIDFEIKDPTMSTLATESTPIRRLSGNEKMLLFYQWWLTGDERIADFDYDIIDFKAFTETVGDGNSADVVQLFVSSAPIYYEFGPKPDTYDPNSINSGFYFDKTTLKVTISVDNSNNLAPSLLLITLLMLLFIIMFI